MEEFVGYINVNGNNYEVNILPLYNEVLGETKYEVSSPGLEPFLMVWEHGLNPGFKIQGVASYGAHEMKEAISTVIEHHYA